MRLQSLVAGLVCVGALVAPGIASAEVPEAPTFANDIAPIFYERCVNCHRPDQIAPMSLITYQEVRPWARSIRNKVETRAMPPWHLDRNIGVQGFKNDPSLTEDQIATILKWVDTGRAAGQPRRHAGAAGVRAGRRLADWRAGSRRAVPDLHRPRGRPGPVRQPLH